MENCTDRRWKAVISNKTDVSGQIKNVIWFSKLEPKDWLGVSRVSKSLNWSIYDFIVNVKRNSSTDGYPIVWLSHLDFLGSIGHCFYALTTVYCCIFKLFFKKTEVFYHSLTACQGWVYPGDFLIKFKAKFKRVQMIVNKNNDSRVQQ